MKLRNVIILLLIAEGRHCPHCLSCSFLSFFLNKLGLLKLIGGIETFELYHGNLLVFLFSTSVGEILEALFLLFVPFWDLPVHCMLPHIFINPILLMLLYFRLSILSIFCLLTQKVHPSLNHFLILVFPWVNHLILNFLLLVMFLDLCLEKLGLFFILLLGCFFLPHSTILVNLLDPLHYILVLLIAQKLYLI